MEKTEKQTRKKSTEFKTQSFKKIKKQGLTKTRNQKNRANKPKKGFTFLPMEKKAKQPKTR